MARQHRAGRRWAVFLIVVAVVLGLLAWVATSFAPTENDPLSQASDIAGVSSFVVAALAIFIQLVQALWPTKSRTVDRAQEFSNAANDLAQAARKRSRDEEDRQKVHDPVPLPVRWHNAPDDVIDHWENIHDVPAGVRSEPVRLDNTVDHVIETFRSVPSQRLVVLGKAGSGKTVLAHHLIHQLLDQRDSTDPVPVLFSLNTWDVTTPLRDWLVAQLRRDYDLDGTDSTGVTLAQALVDNDRILPILDGFDEITAERRTTQENHRTALSALNDTDLPMVLTSRPDEYRDAVAGDLFLAKAAAIELEDLTLDDLASYLTRTSRKTPNGDGDTPWDPVLRHLRDQPHDPASAQLRQVLTTPLMVFLARTIYSAPARRDPTQPLNTAVFRSTQHLADHLLDAFIPAVYVNNTDRSTQRPRPRWRPDQAQRWLGHLADHLTKLNTHDLAWWQLPTTLHRRTRILPTTIMLGLTVGLVHWLAGLAAGFGGLALGLAAGHMNEARFQRTGTAREPVRLRLRIRNVTSAGRRPNTRRLATELSLGLAIGLTGGLATGLTVAGLASGLTFWLPFGLAIGLLIIVLALLGDSRDPQQAVAPWKPLNTDRTVTLICSIAIGLVFGVGYGLMDGLAAGFAKGLTFALVYLMLCAWGNWLLFARLWLPLTRRLPWRPKRFLEDAYRRGVLRQAGAVYQFRHAQLRDHLAAQYRNQPMTSPPPEEAAERDGLTEVSESR